MAFIDSKGSAVNFGDYVAIAVKRSPETDDKVGLVVRICSLKEGVKGVSAVGAFVSLQDGTRVKKVPVHSADATLVMRADGTVPS